MTLEFYKTGFDVSKNGVYESLEEYLGKLAPSLTVPNYKYLDPALSLAVKIPLSSHQFDKSAVGDYVRAKDDDEGKVYYYYVMSCKWKGKETLMVTLALDTLNTYWDGISSSWTAETHITRRFKDRWYTSRTAAYPKIDRKDEDFATVPMKRVSAEAVNPTASSLKWTLVYMTEYASDSNLKNNPVSCYCFPSAKVYISTGASGTVLYKPLELSSSNRYYMSGGMNSGDSFTIETIDGSSSNYVIGDNCGCVLFYPSTHTSGDGTLTDVVHVRIWRYVGNQTNYSDYECSYILFTSCKQVYLQSSDWVGWQGSADFTRPFPVNAGQTVTSLISFNEWYETNKTDPRLIKIRELPYAPFKEAYTDSNLTIPSGWSMSSGMLKFTGTTFGTYFLGQSKKSFPTLAKVDVTARTEPWETAETKLLNSSFYVDKLIYDSNSWIAKWETYNSGTGKIVSGDAGLNINYSVSDGMDNGSLFEVTQGFEYDTDFGQFMVVDKSTDKPYYTNEYLNYIRYGKYIDEKAVGYNVASSVVSGVGSIATTAASLAFGSAAAGASAGVGAVIGAVVGTAMAVISISKTCATAYDSINSKIDQYTHQASSVSGTSDVSLFNVYSGNKLLRVNYEPVDYVKSLLWNYFRLYGYSDDSYEIPTFTRRYVDYFKLEPVFQGDMIWNEFLDDIKQRMQVGFRVFHYVDSAYDLLFEKENWETSLWDWAN